MNDQKRIRAEILSRTTDRVRVIANNLRREGLSADELGTLSIIMGIDRIILEQEEKPALRVIYGRGIGGDNGKELC